MITKLTRFSCVFLSLLMTLNAYTQNDITNVIQSYLDKNYEALELQQTDVQNWLITDDVASKTSPLRHVYIAQTVNGIILKNGVANFALNQENEVVHMGNRLVADLGSKLVGGSQPTFSATQAIEAAKIARGMTGDHGAFLKETDKGRLLYSKGNLSKEDVEVYTAYWNVKDKVRLVWIVSLYALDGKHWWQSFIDAESGEEIDHLDWVVSCDFPDHSHSTENCSKLAEPINSDFKSAPVPPGGPGSYNVFAMPIESPNHGNRTIEVEAGNPSASPYGWHDTNGSVGEEYTITRGNNVYAYEDASDNNSPGFSPNGGGSLVFDFSYSGANSPTANQSAAITNLFYWNNLMHDIWYQYGFDEPSGNFQDNNYGNGGQNDDYVLAEAQDGSGTNNANFATPEDGFNPRMQMYLWTSGGSTQSDYLEVNSPAPIQGTYSATDAVFGPGLPNPPITADVVLAVDNTSPVNDGCQTITNSGALSGKIALIDRGDCNFTVKVENAQNAGAVAVIIVNNVGGAPVQMGGTSNSINIPSIMISMSDGDAIKAQLLSGTVNATISTGSSQNAFRDSDFDNGIIAHEYGHGISNRLTGGPSNSNCLSNDEQMGEGWSDWFGLMLTIEPGDAGTDGRGIGTYAGGQPTTGTGIRPAPYSTDFGINPYTYGDSNDQNNISQPHGVGFIYATALWDMTWALIDYYGGTPDPDVYNGSGGNNVAMRLVTESLKLQPCGPGMIDGRDAILEADQLLYGGEHQCIIWNAFADRGFGYSADQGSSNSRTDQTEAFDLPQSCLEPTTAPTAAFVASTYQTCDPEVSFEDQSTDIPQEWDWDFGDGGTSTQPNPTHVFTAEGTFTVELTVTNPFGSSTTTQQVIIDLPDAPVASDVSICEGESAELIATSTGISVWRDGANDVVHEGDTLTLNNVTSQASYTVENVVAPPLGNVGPVNPNFGSGSYHNSTYHGALNFTASQGFEIVSAWVDADGAGSRTISLASGTNNSGNPPGQVVDQVVVDLANGGQRVDLNLIVPDAGNYNIGGNNVNLYRNDGGSNYPYTLAGVMTINSSSANTSPTGYYYYFYDIEVREIPCISLPVNVTVSPVTTNFSYSETNGVYTFTDLSTNASSWFWDFGGGSTSTDQNPTHTYSQAGNYTVTLTVNGQTDCAADEAINAVVGINDVSNETFSMTLVPNPTNTGTKVVFSMPLEKDAQLFVYAVDGRVVQEMTLQQGTQQIELNVNHLAKGFYRVVVNPNAATPIGENLMIAD